MTVATAVTRIAGDSEDDNDDDSDDSNDSGSGDSDGQGMMTVGQRLTFSILVFGCLEV